MTRIIIIQNGQIAKVDEFNEFPPNLPSGSMITVAFDGYEFPAHIRDFRYDLEKNVCTYTVEI